MRSARDKGTVLVTSMIVLFVMMGLVVSLYTVVMYSSRESERNVEFASALEAAESGVERAIAAMYRARINNDFATLAGLEPPAGTGTGRWTLYSASDGNPYTVQLRSLKRDGQAIPNGVFDVYEITAMSTPVGREGYIRGAQAIVELPLIMRQEDIAPIPGALYIASGHQKQLAGNYSIDGADHSARTTYDIVDGVKLNVPAKLQHTYFASHAGYRSEFWVYNKTTGERHKIFDDSKDGEPIGATMAQVFPAGTELNFYIHTYNTGDKIEYDHYAFGDGPDAVYQPTKWVKKGNKWVEVPNGDPIRYARVEQLDDVTYRIFFEDLPGAKADWDYGKPGDLTVEDCIRSTGGDGPDQVVDVVILPDGTYTGMPITTAASGYSRNIGIPAIGYDGAYEDLGISVNDTHILTKTPTGDVYGEAAYANAYIPVDAYVNLIKQHTPAANIVTSLGSGNNAVDLGSPENPKVIFLDGNAGTLAGKRTGAGLLVVNGDMHISGQFEYDGLIIVNGNFMCTGGGNGTHVMGAVIVNGDFKITGTADIKYSSANVDLALAKAGLTREDLKALIPPRATNVEPPVMRLWRQLDHGQLLREGFLQASY